jgi:hypothetical protein
VLGTSIKENTLILPPVKFGYLNIALLFERSKCLAVLFAAAVLLLLLLLILG